MSPVSSPVLHGLEFSPNIYERPVYIPMREPDSEKGNNAT